jgi:uncharacterized protein with PIN domain
MPAGSVIDIDSAGSLRRPLLNGDEVLSNCRLFFNKTTFRVVGVLCSGSRYYFHLYMIITKELFEAGRSEAGGYNLAQLKAIGLPMPARGWPATGWPSRIIGSTVTDAQYQEFFALRGKSKKKVRYEGVGDLFPVIDLNVESVKAKMEARAKVGFRKYGVTTERADFSLIDWLKHAQEESINQVIYLEAAIKMEEQRIEEARECAGVRPENFANELFEKSGRDLS